MSSKRQVFAAGFAACLVVAASSAMAQSDDVVLLRGADAMQFALEVPPSSDPYINAAEGEQVVVVNRAGRVTIIEGPYNGLLSEAVRRSPNTILGRIGRLLGQERWSSTWGGTRSGSSRDGAPHLPAAADVLDLSASRTTDTQRQCVSRSHAPTVWRNAVDGVSRAVISTPGEPASILEFARGDASAPWPRFLPMRDDAVYYVSYPDEAAPTQMFRLIKISNAASESELISTLVEVGCDDQASLAMARFLATRGEILE